MRKTAVDRQKDAEHELWTLLAKRRRNRSALSEATRSVFSTAEFITMRPALPSTAHRGFAERHPVAFRKIMIGIVDKIRKNVDPKVIYRGVVREAKKFDLTLTRQPWKKPQAKTA